MKLLFFTLSSLVFAIAAAQEPSLSCSYFNYDEVYGCELSIDNPNGFNNFTEIGGIHLEGFTNADVNVLYRSNGTTANIPQIICNTFPNIVDFELYGSQITEIDDTAFSGCSRVRQIYLFYNRITTISENAFTSLREIVYMNLGENWLTSLPANVFANQQNLTDLSLSGNTLTNLPTELFRPLENLQFLYLDYTNLTTINSEWFTTNSNLYYLNVAGNRISATADNFAGLQQLQHLNLVDNGISEIPPGTFAGLTNLQSLQLYGNSFSVLGANTFSDLRQLNSLDIGNNPLTAIGEDAFQGLDSLTSLYLSYCLISELDSNSFAGLNNLTYLDLNFNSIEELPPGIFATLPAVNYIGLWDNRLKTLRRNIFGNLTSLRTLDLDDNIVNAIDPAIIDEAVSLNTLYFSRNLCANEFFGNFIISRATYLPMLETCFQNMRYIIDTTTEGDGIYSFFEAPQPGIVLRVRSDNEVQIALTPFEFIWEPSVEIFIGATNNTRSVIRINDETNVVTVPTRNIIQQNQWNDFRVTWANQNVLVFRANETYPFMSYTMQQFFPVNFYGLRAVETRATWSVQPFEP